MDDLLLRSVSFYINLARDCMLHKQMQNNFPAKLAAGVTKEMEGMSEYPRVLLIPALFTVSSLWFYYSIFM